MRTTTDLQQQMQQFVHERDDWDGEHLLQEVESGLQRRRRTQGLRWLAAVCVAGTLGLGVLVDLREGADPDPLPAGPLEGQLRDPDVEPAGLPEFQLGLQRVGVVGLPAGASLTVTLDQVTAEAGPVHAAIACEGQATATDATVGAQVDGQEVTLLCESPADISGPLYPTALPPGETLTVRREGAGAMTMAIYQEVPYEAYPEDAALDPSVSLVGLAETGTTRVLRPQADAPAGPNTWEWDITVGQQTGLEVWASARGRMQLSVNGRVVDYSSSGGGPGVDLGWRDGWWVQWGTNPSTTIDLSPESMQELGVAVPTSGRVTVRAVSQDLAPEDWLLIVHGRGDAMPVEASPHLPDGLPGMELLAAVEVHPHSRDVRVTLPEPLRPADLRFAPVCSIPANDAKQPQPVVVRTPTGTPLTLTCTPGGRPAELATLPSEEAPIEELFLSGVVLPEQQDGQVNLNHFPIHLGIYRADQTTG